MKKKSKTIPLNAAHCWPSDPPGTSIKLAAKNFVVLVRRNPAKKAGHPSLWRELDKLLKQKGLWSPEMSKQPTTKDSLQLGLSPCPACWASTI